MANPAYQNFLSTNSDCANFVSQCFAAGGYAYDGTWYPYTSAWAGNWALHNWLLSSGRGYAQTSASILGYADIVNYDWEGNGSFDHVAIVTALPGPLISSHTKNHRNVPWSYPASIYPHPQFSFASTHVYY